ncbi:hypothetical protein [Sulfobacillus harzensis]|uniref:Uncharacterized protein n=1 Tax=Sulfobacillus harzensis TaxID=2729629 RepID=A0A7Y0L046_9FIRM|nr:hypothetical protein [Sulfobacillus harzensis]NMP20802.1 hypothetical protein [Sulfobacillus harzensis]
MRYLAQFSEAPRTAKEAFWDDALNTERWLQLEGKRVAKRSLLLKARSMRALRPWLPFQSQPLAIDAWLDPMEISVTWSYLVRFLAELGPERVWIPAGEDAWVGWMGHQLVVRASRESWLWALVEDVWDPASWSSEEDLEWWAEGRIQHARRLSWGVSEERSWLTGWEEWTLTVPENKTSKELTALWTALAERLGARPVRVKWRQERVPETERLLGLPARFASTELAIQGTDAHWLDRLRETPEPLHIRASALWSVPNWSPGWATAVTLRRVQRGSRLEATYMPVTPLSTANWRTLQRERRQIPILQIRPLALPWASSDPWQSLREEARSHHHRERLTHFLTEYPWPLADTASPRRLRLGPQWSIWRWGSQSGIWVFRSRAGLEIQVEWPTQAHPGHIGVSALGSPPIAMSEWIGKSRFNRLAQDNRYWAQWLVAVLMPALVRYQEEAGLEPH